MIRDYFDSRTVLIARRSGRYGIGTHEKPYRPPDEIRRAADSDGVSYYQMTFTAN